MAKSKFRKAMEKAFDEHGEKAIQIGWVEQPVKMLEMMHRFEPRQLKYEGVSSTLTDEQLAAMDEALAWAAEARVPATKTLPAPQPGGITIVGLPRSHAKETHR